jgi:hypothetical protein
VLQCYQVWPDQLAFCCSETVTMLAKILTKDIGYCIVHKYGRYTIYPYPFFAMIVISYNILFLGLDMDRI